MRIQRDAFIGLLRAVRMGSVPLIRAKALIMAGDAKDAGAIEQIEAIFGKAVSELLIPHDLAGLVREAPPWAKREDLVLAPDLCALLDGIAMEHGRATDLRERGLEPISRVLFHGPSGTGKTSVAVALAADLGVPLLVCPMDTIVSSLLGESSSRLRKVVEFASKLRCVLLLDEIDAIGKVRGGRNEVGEQGRIVTTLLVLLDDMRRARSEALVVAATNMRDALDPALVRRFDVERAFALSTDEEQIQICQRVFDRAGVAGDFGMPWSGPRAAAEVECWALEIAKREVLAGRVRKVAAE